MFKNGLIVLGVIALIIVMGTYSFVSAVRGDGNYPNGYFENEDGNPTNRPREPRAKVDCDPVRVTFVNDARNEMAKEIIGTWVVDAETSKLLTDEFREDHAVSISLRDSETAAAKLTKAADAYAQRLAQSPSKKQELEEFRRAMETVYKVGELEVSDSVEKSTIRTFAFCVWHGCPYLLALSETGRADGLYIAIAIDPVGDKDLLFLRGENSQRASLAMKRKPK